MSLFSKNSKKCLGIDVGATSIKVVELAVEKNNLVLKNYGISSIKEIGDKKKRTKNEKTFSSSTDLISKTLKAILKETGIKTRRSVFSIPDFSSFFTSFEVPKMKKSEVEWAIHFQARQRVPLPLNEVTLDWKLTNLIEKKGEELVEVLLLAVPNEIVSSYREIAKESNLEMGSLDAETFGLAKVFGKKEETVVVVDIGDQSTTVNIIKEDIPKHSNSLSIAGKDFTENFAILPDVNYNEKESSDDEEKKEERRKIKEVSKKVKESLSEDLVRKVKEVCNSYQAEEGEEVKEVVLTGGASKFKEVKEAFSNEFSVSEINSFSNLKYPLTLEPAVREVAPLFPVAVGMALEGLKYKK
jgi:type IV pilus assembly protein PilM